MKLAIDCRQFGASGIGTYIENVVSYIVERNENQYVLIGDPSRLSSYDKRENCFIVPCVHHPFTWKELFMFPTKEVNQCDAFYTPNFNIPAGIKVPIFSTIHDVVFFDVEGVCSPIGKAIRYAYIKRALLLSKELFTVSPFSRSRIDSIFHTKKIITVIYIGVSRELMAYKKEQNTPQKENQFVFLGNLKKQKGITTLLKAFRMAKEKGLGETRLVVIGNIDFRTKDDAAIKLLNEAGEDIVCVRNASNRDVFDIISRSRALISPSRYEGFGLPPLEAMYLGTPAIISDIPVYKEIYGKTDAIFFQVDHPEDLCDKLLSFQDKTVNIDNIIREKYNFHTAANVILNNITNAINETSNDYQK